MVVLDVVVPVAIALVLVGILFTGAELGYRMGRRSRLRSEADAQSQAATWEGALLGLLALLTGFTFAMAVTRFDNRREQILDEANAIQEVALRAEVLEDPAEQLHVKRLLHDYLDARVEFYRAGIQREKVEAAQRQGEAIFRQLWTVVMHAAKQRFDDIMALFVDATGDLARISATRRTALENHVPEPVMLVLILVAATGAAATGYSCGLHGRRHRLGMVLLPMLIAIVVWLVLDLDHPRIGLIRAGQGPMLRLQQSELFKQP